MTPKPTKIPKPPPSLCRAGRAYWRIVWTEFQLEDWHVPILQSACEQLDRAAAARDAISKSGVVVKDRFGQAAEHPAVRVERQAHNSFRLLMRELGLGIEPAETRGPRRPGTGR